MTMIQTKFMDDYIDYDFLAGIFMSAFLFTLTCGLSNTSKIIDFKARLYVSIFLNHYYAEYYQKLDEYDLCVISFI